MPFGSVAGGGNEDDSASGSGGGDGRQRSAAVGLHSLRGDGGMGVLVWAVVLVLVGMGVML